MGQIFVPSSAIIGAAGVANLTGPEPRLIFTETDQGANQQKWDIDVQGDIMRFRALLDSGAVQLQFMSIQRTGSGVNTIDFTCRDSIALSTSQPGSTITLDSAGALNFNAVGDVNCSLNNTNFDIAFANLRLSTIGKGVQVAEGANAKQGLTGAMVAGTLLVANTSVTANSRIQLTRQAGGANAGAVFESARVAGTSFTVSSTNAADTGQVAFEIFEPA